MRRDAGAHGARLPVQGFGCSLTASRCRADRSRSPASGGPRVRRCSRRVRVCIAAPGDRALRSRRAITTLRPGVRSTRVRGFGYRHDVAIARRPLPRFRGCRGSMPCIVASFRRHVVRLSRKGAWPRRCVASRPPTRPVSSTDTSGRSASASNWPGEASACCGSASRRSGVWAARSVWRSRCPGDAWKPAHEPSSAAFRAAVYARTLAGIASSASASAIFGVASHRRTAGVATAGASAGTEMGANASITAKQKRVIPEARANVGTSSRFPATTCNQLSGDAAVRLRQRRALPRRAAG